VKIMGIEGHYRSHPNGAPLILLGLPDQQEGKGQIRPSRFPKWDR